MPVPAPTPQRRKPRRRLLLGSVAVLVIGLGLLASWLWYFLFRVGEIPQYTDPGEHYRYGALQVDRGFPIRLWKVLPDVFPDRLPGGWRTFGFVFEPGHEYPVGFAEVEVGYRGLLANCALCHVGSVRRTADDVPQVLTGAPAHELDFDRFQNAVIACAADERFRADVLVPAMERQQPVPFLERQFFGRVLIPALKRKLLEQKASTAWMLSRPATGCGRIDAFNKLKLDFLKLEDDGSVGTSDMSPLWHQQARDGLWKHWNGSGLDRHQENLLSGLTLVQNVHGLDQAAFERVGEYLGTLPPPPFPGTIDAARAARGRGHFERHCARCHQPGGAGTGQVLPIAEAGTDPTFLAGWSPALVARLHEIKTPPYDFSGMRVTAGVNNVLLDGCWARAPYLHNGSVPTLKDLLTRAADRPKRFRRGGNLLDAVNVGFVTGEADANGFLFDVAQPGNGNQGHEFGCELDEEAKWELIEYLKTL